MAPDPLDRLYGLPPAEFTPARDALAKELRAAGDKDGAAAVKALRKPSAAAWAINAAVRSRGDALRELLDAGEGLRAAQARLLAGTGDRAELRAAAEAERFAVAAMTAAAAETARQAGQGLSASVEARVRETLHAAALHDEVRDAVAAGRVEREAEASGFAGAAGFATAPALPARAPSAPRKRAAEAPPAKAAAKRKSGAAGKPSRDDAAGRKREAKAAAERLRKAREAARSALAKAGRRLRDAERTADVAARRLERAEAAAEDARRRLADAEARAETQRVECAEAQKDLRDAKGAAAAAQAAHDQAEA